MNITGNAFPVFEHLLTELEPADRIFIKAAEDRQGSFPGKGEKDSVLLYITCPCGCLLPVGWIDEGGYALVDCGILLREIVIIPVIREKMKEAA